MNGNPSSRNCRDLSICSTYNYTDRHTYIHALSKEVHGPLLFHKIEHEKSFIGPRNTAFCSNAWVQIQCMYNKHRGENYFQILSSRQTPGPSKDPMLSHISTRSEQIHLHDICTTTNYFQCRFWYSSTVVSGKSSSKKTIRLAVYTLFTAVPHYTITSATKILRPAQSLQPLQRSARAANPKRPGLRLPLAVSVLISAIWRIAEQYSTTVHAT